MIGLLNLKNFGNDSFSNFIVVFAFIYPIISFISLYFWVNSKGHNSLFSKTEMEFDNDFIYLMRNGNQSKITPNSIQKIIDQDNHWLLYISKGLFIYIPKNIFYSIEDMGSFVNLISKHGKSNSI